MVKEFSEAVVYFGVLYFASATLGVAGAAMFLAGLVIWQVYA